MKADRQHGLTVVKDRRTAADIRTEVGNGPAIRIDLTTDTTSKSVKVYKTCSCGIYVRAWEKELCLDLDDSVSGCLFSESHVRCHCIIMKKKTPTALNLQGVSYPETDEDLDYILIIS